ncbi:MAG: cytochrome c [Pseudomonadota bacterium]
MRATFAAAAALVATVAVAAPQAAGLPAGPGQQQVQAGCGGCHAMTVITGKHYSAAKWETVVDGMIDRGAKVSDADYELVVAYLAKHFGAGK